MEIFYLSFFIFGGISVFFKVQRVRRLSKEKYLVLEVKVSRENENGPIVAEPIFATLHGLKSKFSFLEKFKGYGPQHLGFEIANINKTIKFYLSLPARLKNLVEGQFYAQYPDAEITEVSDYTRDVKYAKNAVSAELKLEDSDIYPIKRHVQFEDKLTRVDFDPLRSITASMVKVENSEDQVWVQMVVAPLPDKWRIVLTKCVKIISRGLFGNIESLQHAFAKAFTTRKLWPKVVFFPVYFFFWIRGIMVNMGKDTFATAKPVEEVTSYMHERESKIVSSIDKVIRPLFEVNVRISYIPKVKNQDTAEIKLREVVSSFKQFNMPYLNGFEMDGIIHGERGVHAFQKRLINDGFILNNEELATIYHLPNLTVKTPLIVWVDSRKLEPPPNIPLKEEDKDNDITVLGKTRFRGQSQIFGLKTIDRSRHVYVIGKTGMGKSTLLENMIYSDIINGYGVGVVDPHGDLAQNVLSFVPKNRINDVIVIDPADKEYAVAINLLEEADPAVRPIITSSIIGIFKKIYADSWGPRLEHILRNVIYSLLFYPGTSMLGITRILQDQEYRNRVVKKIEDPVIKSFWVNEFDKMTEKFRVEAISPILNKVGQFLASPVIRNIVGQVNSTIDFRFAMDKGKIVVINLSKGKIGEDNSALLGAMFVTQFQLAAMSRADVAARDRKNFYLYVDEFQNFATESFATILSEARKYALNLTIANQYIAQMPEEVQNAVMGNVGTILAFQLGFDDASFISEQFGEEVMPPDLTSLSKYHAYLKLLVEGTPSKVFSVATIPSPSINQDPENVQKIIKVSRERYGTKISEVEDKIKRWSFGKEKDYNAQERT